MIDLSKFWNQHVKCEHLACLFSISFMMKNCKCRSHWYYYVNGKIMWDPWFSFMKKSDCSMFICTSPIFAIYFAWFLMMYSKIHWISCFDGCINICNQLVCLYAVFDCMRAEYFISINNLIELYFMYEFRFNGTFLKKKLTYHQFCWSN